MDNALVPGNISNTVIAQNPHTTHHACYNPQYGALNQPPGFIEFGAQTPAAIAVATVPRFVAVNYIIKL